MLVGEGPGDREDREGTPFVGPAGQELDELLELAGIPRSDVYVTNTVKCRPPENRDPRVSEVTACRGYLIQEIADVQPEVIIAIGGSALNALTGNTAVGRSRGRRLAAKVEYRTEAFVIATWHPAAAMHNPARKDRIYTDIVSDFRLAGRQTGDIEVKPEYVSIAGGFNPAQTVAAFRTLNDCPLLACDLEWDTSSGGWWPWSRRNGVYPELVSVALAGRTPRGIVGLSVPFESKWWKYAVALIERKPTVYHLGIETSDLNWLSAKQIKYTVAADTYTLARLLNVSASDYGLKTLAPMMTDFPPGWAAEVRDDAGLLGRTPLTAEEWERMLIYNSRDAIATLLLYEALLEYGERTERRLALNLHDRILTRALKVFAEMAVNGLPVDGDRIRQAEVHGRRRLERIRRELGEMLGVGERYDLLDSDNKIARLLEYRLGITLPRTPTGKPSIAAGVRINQTHPVFRILDEKATTEKRNNTYFRPWRRLLELQGTERLHTIYRPHGTDTGRSSATMEMGATLQQFPRGKEIRSLVRARPGYKIVAGDESQIELRVAADISGDERLRRYFRESKDVHRMTAGITKALAAGHTLESFLANEDALTADITPLERQGAKPVNFGLIYGGGVDMLILNAKKDYEITLTRAQAELFVQAYFALYPGIAEWHRRAELEVVPRGYTETMFGRQRYLPDEELHELVRKAVNTPTQSAANDITYCAMVRLDEELERRNLKLLALFIGYIHDSILLEVKDEAVEEVVALMRECMIHPPLDRLGITLSVPLDADVLVGQDWGYATKLKAA